MKRPGLVQKKVSVRTKKGTTLRTMWVRASPLVAKKRVAGAKAAVASRPAAKMGRPLTPGAKRKRTITAGKRKGSQAMDDIVNRFRGDQIAGRLHDAIRNGGSER